MGEILTSAARKAQVAALIAFLGPLATFVAVEGDWSWRAFVGALITAAIAGLTVYEVRNRPTVGAPLTGGTL